MSTPVISIDFGTTTSRVAVYKNDKVEVITNDHGSRGTPSYVGFTNEEILVGEEAKYNGNIEPESTIYGFKQLLGWSMDEKLSEHVYKDRLFSVVTDEYGFPKILARPEDPNQFYTPEQLLVKLLSKLKQSAEIVMEQEVKHAVVTVPSFFNINQRQAVVNATNEAGLPNIHLINETIAAAINCIYRNRNIQGNVLVLNLGGGILDISLLTINGMDFQVKSTLNNRHIEGEDFTRKLVEHFIALFKKKHKRNLKNSKYAIWRLREACESLKIKLSSSPKVKFYVHAIMNGIDINETVTRDKFNEINDKTFSSIEEAVREVLTSVDTFYDQVDKVIVTGGSSRIPQIQKFLEKSFTKKKIISALPNVDEAAIYGATLYAHLLNFNRISVIDLLPREVSYYFNNTGFPNRLSFKNAPLGSDIVGVKVPPDVRFLSIYEGGADKDSATYLGDCASRSMHNSSEDDLSHKIEFFIDNNRILKATEHYERTIPIHRKSRKIIDNNQLLENNLQQ